MTLHTWLSSATTRHYPDTRPPEMLPAVRLDGARNARMGFQLALRLQEGEPQTVQVRASAPEGWQVRVRRVGYVPVRHHNTPVSDDPLETDGLGQIPGYVPDALFDENTLILPAGETHAFWFTVQPPEDAPAGDYQIAAEVEAANGEVRRHSMPVHVYAVTLQPRRDFHVTQWLYVDALIDWYQTKLFDERFWEILPRYLLDLAEHGADTVIVPAFTLSLDGVKRPSQLLRVARTGPDRYALDWTDVRRYVRLAQDCGLTHFEWGHLFTQWGARYALRVYEGQGEGESLLWPPETPGVSDTYRAFLAQFLPELRRFVEQEGIANRSFYHVSDEPHGEEQLVTYRAAREMLRELAPWMQVMDALTQIEFARQGLTDMPAPSTAVAPEFAAEGIASWCYYCCFPRGPYINSLLDTPLPKIAMHGFLFYRWAFHGFLHWGYNYWYQRATRQLIDPYCEQDGLAWHQGWAYGDTFRVYPGPRGPIDSIRWEIFAEAMQDYALLQTLGISRDDPLFERIFSFADFPKEAGWREAVRRRLLERG
jgi:hypothetical protein